MAAVLYEPLHHKYRPQTFAQLVGQSAIASTLTHALEQNKIAPAYLFCGPRGTGKTSSARILAKSLNCLSADSPTPKPCGKCDLCLSVSRGNALDIVEIDAASNTGVDNIRELIERAQFAPVQCRYKVYVIDECHMLSVAAFNALLKTLEEPPERVVFVLATTDPQRVLPTIISRCQRFDFRRIPLPAMIRHLSYIAKKEEINIAESALQLVAQIAQGGLRDAESLLDQLSLQVDEITVETVWDLVGAVPERDLLNLVRAIAADDGAVLIDRVRNLMDKGREPLVVLQGLVGFYRDLLIAKTAPKREDLVAIAASTWAEMAEFVQKLPAAQILASQQKLQAAEVQIKNTTQPRLWLEITLTSLLPSALGAAAALSEDRASAKVAAVGVTPVRAIAQTPAASTTTNHPAQSVVGASSTPIDEETAAAKIASERPSLELDAARPTVPNTSHNIAAQTPLDSSDVSATDRSTASNGLPSQSKSDATSELSALDPAFGSLSNLWQKVLSALEPRGTQMLMSQQGILLAFDGVGAKVGFKSASLQKMARERVPNLEKALASIFNRPIKVSLEVVSLQKGQSIAGKDVSPVPPQKASVPGSAPDNLSSIHASPSNSLPDSSADNRLNSVGSTPLKEDGRSSASRVANEEPSTSQNGSGRLDPASTTPTASLYADESGLHTLFEKPADNLPSAPSSAAPGQWQTNQEQENIKRFAQFFNGQIVNLDDDLGFSEADKNPIQKKKPSSEPGPDVPF